MKIVQHRKIYFSISAIIIAIGIIFMIINASAGVGTFNFDVEFSGGTSVNIDLGQDFSNDDVTKIIEDTTGQTGPQVQRIIGTNEVNFKILSVDQETRVKLIDTLQEKYGFDDKAVNIEDVSSTVSGEMQQTALTAVVVSCIAILLYTSLRFRDFKTGSSAILALIHDAAVVLAAYAILRIPLNVAFIAAILTVLGYSINATIVIFDRIRENKRRANKFTQEQLIDLSVSQTLRRSVYTSLTTLLTVASLYVFGVTSVKDFTLPIIIGIVCGTYSSVCLAGSIWYVMSKKPKVAK